MNIFDEIKNGNIEFVKKFIDQRGEFVIHSKNGETPFHFAVYFEQLDIIKLLIKKKIDINIKNKDDNTPLHYAVFFGKNKIAKLLINNGADITIENKHKETPLINAIKSYHIDIVETIVNYHNNINKELNKEINKELINAKQKNPQNKERWIKIYNIINNNKYGKGR